MARPTPVRVLRVLLWADAALTAVLVLAGLLTAGVSAPVLAELLVMAWPGAVAGAIAPRLDHRRRAHAAWLPAAVGWQTVLAVLELLGGDPRGLTSLPLPLSIAVLLLTRPVRAWPRSSYGDTGATALEYIGVIALAALILGGLVALGLPAQTTRATRTAVCTVVDRSGCDDQRSRQAPTRSVPPSSNLRPSILGATVPRCNGLLECAWRMLTTDPHEVVQNVPCNSILTCVIRGAGELAGSQWNLDKAILDDVKGIGDLLAHPGSLIDAAQYIHDHPGEAIRQLVWDDESAKQWNNGNYVGAVTRGIWNVGSWFIPGGQLGKAMSKAGKFGKLGKVVDKAGELGRFARTARAAERAASDAERAAKAGDLKRAERSLREARRQENNARRRAASAGCAGVALGRYGVHLEPGPNCRGLAAAKRRTAAANRAINNRWAQSVTFATKQIQHEWKHAKDFGISENFKLKTSPAMYANTVRSFMRSPGVRRIVGNYRGQGKAVFFYEAETRRVVFLREDGRFWGAFRISPKQAKSLVNQGWLF